MIEWERKDVEGRYPRDGSGRIHRLAYGAGTVRGRLYGNSSGQFLQRHCWFIVVIDDGAWFLTRCLDSDGNAVSLNRVTKLTGKPIKFVNFDLLQNEQLESVFEKVGLRNQISGNYCFFCCFFQKVFFADFCYHFLISPTFWNKYLSWELFYDLRIWRICLKKVGFIFTFF